MLTPIVKMLDRARTEKAESDAGYFDMLLYTGEMVVKLVVAGLVAGLHDDKDRRRYYSEYRLARADSLGKWIEVLDEVLLGPSAQFLDEMARPTCVDLTRKTEAGSWQAGALADLLESLRCVQVDPEDRSNKIQGKEWFSTFVHLRNKTRHGAPSATAMGRACPSLERSIRLVAENLPLLSLPWAYLHQNLSGKYRVTNWSATDEKFEQLKRDTRHSLPNGVYVSMDEIHRVAMVDSDAEGTDYWFANGDFKEKDYEMLSYLTNNRERRPSEPYRRPVEELPPSETQGLGRLDLKGKTFSNLPEPMGGYITRKKVEQELKEQLCDIERHFIVTLTGRGGIGKTSTAIQVISDLVGSEECPYGVVVWFSARDIDLLESGPKPVRPHGVSVRDFADAYSTWLEPREMREKGFNPTMYFAHGLSGEVAWPTLFVFDNFETTVDPTEVFTWLDSQVRKPNKVLITSRDRAWGFKGDYPIEVDGMTHEEAEQLITHTSSNLKISDRLSGAFIDRLVSESGGHPYIIKLLLGEIARSGAAAPERILAAHDRGALTALFERSYRRLSPGAQRVFLTLCKWRASIPAIALEAVLLRPQNEERFDVQSAVEELVRTSFIEESIDKSINESELYVPLAARLYGYRELDVSRWRASIEEDASMLHMLGAQSIGMPFSLEQRINRLFKNVADMLSKDQGKLSDFQPILDFIASQYAFAFALLADLVAERGMADEEEKYLISYVQGPENLDRPAWRAWGRIADIRRSNSDAGGELDALAQICRRANTPVNVLSNTASRVNTILATLQGQLSREEKQMLIREVEGALKRHLQELDATDLSRLSWLQIHLGETEAALSVAEKGLKIDPYNIHCQRLVSRLNPQKT